MNYKSILIFLLLGFVLPVFSMPFTTLGDANIPNAYVLSHKMAQVSYTQFFNSEKDVDEYIHEYGLVMNLGLFNRGSLGFVAIPNNDQYHANVKLQLIEENEIYPAISIGVENLFSQVKDFRDNKVSVDQYDFPDFDDYIRNSFYFVMTKTTLLRGLPFVPFIDTKFNFGVGSRRFKGGKVMKQLAGMFFGLEFRPSEYFSILSEMDGHNVNIGMSANIKNLTFRGVLHRVEEFDNNDKVKIALNLIYTFDVFSEVKYKDRDYSYAKKRNVVPGKRYYTTDGDYESENPVLNELEDIRNRRKKAEKELEEIRKILEEE